jgi:hypothetical protein
MDSVNVLPCGGGWLASVGVALAVKSCGVEGVRSLLRAPFATAVAAIFVLCAASAMS